MVNKKDKYRINGKRQNRFTPLPKRKNGFSTVNKILTALALIVIVVVAASIALSSQSQPQNTNQQISQQTLAQSYPQNVSPVTYNTAQLSTDGNKVTVPSSYVNSSKLVFVDLNLKTPLQTLQYQSRTIPLANYRNGGYLPLVIISTPSGNTVAGIRTCEPCESFSFHIVKGTNLKCDVCGTEWTLENFAPASGGCTTYPPPKLSTTVNGDNVEINLSPLQVQVLA